MKKSYSEIEAVGLALAGFTCWVLADSLIKLVGSSKLPAYEVVGFFGLFMALFLGLRGLARGEARLLWPKRPKRQVVRSCLDLINNICVVVALRHLPMTLFYILVFLAPMVTAILAAIFLHERLDWRKTLAILAGFAGVVIAVNPFSSARQGDWIGVATCMICVACFSVNMVWSRVMTQTEKPESLVFFSGIASTIYGFSLMIHHIDPLTGQLVAALVAMGFFGALGSVCFYTALKHAPAAHVSNYHYTQLLTGALIAYIFWHEIPALSMVLGGVLIVASGLSIAVDASRAGLPGSPLPPALPEE
jgi:drug/metabolite transporter (DMT)-like permease